MDPVSTAGREEIAIIGMAGRFPGARNIDEFWQNLRAGVESVTTVTAEDLEAEGIDPAVSQNPAFVNAGAVLDEAGCFDAEFFGYHPQEAALMDPQHRIFLECAWTALEHAGYDPEQYDGLIGAFGGVARNSYLLHNLAPRRDLLASLGAHPAIIATDKDFVVTRVSYKLDLRGPSITVQTACSTSGVAIHLACQSLLAGECDIALAGGARVRVPMRAGYLYEEGGIQSPDGHCRAFDANAQGTVVGSGVAIVALKRRNDALRDGDSIYALIKGSAINNDGSGKIGFTAPGIDGQARVIAEALALAGVDAETIRYVEAHGTGTALGDPIEMAALTQAFRRSTQRRAFCAVGSVKTNIGHLDAGAGAAGVIKTVLALHHELLPPSLNFQTPNPQIDFANSPFYVNTKLVPWKAGAAPRRAGVSSFGLGGTNAHIILEEAPPLQPSGTARPWQLLFLSAKTAPALDKATTQLADYLRNHAAIDLADVAYTLHVGRRSFAHRGMLVCRDSAEAASCLERPQDHRRFTRKTERSDPPVVFMFPGQGAQAAGMAGELFVHEPTYRHFVDLGAEILRPHLGSDLRHILYPNLENSQPAAQRLRQTAFAQPALFVVEFALAQLWIDWGVAPKWMIGHSIGEYVAACLAGVFSLEDALRLLATRSRLMQDLPEGAMLAVSLPERAIREWLTDKLSLAAVNSPSQCVVSGPRQDVLSLEKQLRDRRIACRQLNTSHAFHSPMVEPIVSTFQHAVAQVKLHPPRIPFISGVAGRWITESEATNPGYWASHLRETVRFADGLRHVVADADPILLEVGPGSTLSSLANQSAAEPRRPVVLASLGDLGDPPSARASTLRAAGRLWLEGVRLNGSRFWASEKRRRIALPTYPFERKRHWIDPPPPGSAPPASSSTRVSLPSDSPSNPESATAEQVRLQGDGDPSASRSSPSTPANPIESITLTLTRLLHDLSGLDMAALDSKANFFALGFDSLFLTQVSMAVQKQFGVKVGLRSLMEDLSSMDQLAAYIEKTLPAEPDACGAHVEPAALIQTAPVAALPAKFENSAIRSAQAVTLYASKGTAVVSTSATGAQKYFGPFQPIDKGPQRVLTAKQQRFLSDLIVRYNRRTRSSKRFTQAHRAHLADPRSISGFRSLWKEMVYPIVAARSSGSKSWDLDGNPYVDLTMGFGAYLFGHSPSFVVEALERQLHSGMQIGPQSPWAGEVAALVAEFTAMERVTFCNTGSEAVLAALRAARTVSGRSRIALFAGSYHGIVDEVLVRPHGGTGQGVPIAPGIPPEAAQNVVVLQYDHPESLEFLRQHGSEFAAVLVEPVQSRRPDLQPREFLRQLRALTAQSNTALIFDEVVTGFRLHPGGAQAWFDVQADLAAYGKVLGGGMPIGVVAGKARFLNAFDGGIWYYGDTSAPEADITFFAGTFVRHPLALAAAAAVLHQLKKCGSDLHQQLNQNAALLAQSLKELFEGRQVPLQLRHCESIFYFSYDTSDEGAALLFYCLREKGVHLLEGRPWFLSTAHSEEDLRQVTRAFELSIDELQGAGFLGGDSRQEPPVTTRCPRNEKAASLSPPPDSETHDPLPAPGPATGGQPKTIPLTASQREIWLAAQLGEPACCAYNESMTLGLRGPLNLEAIRQALQAVVDRHEALRTIIPNDNGNAQRILPHLTLEIPFIDLSTLEANRQQTTVTQLLFAEGRRPFELASGPLIRTKIIRLEAQHHLVVLTVHHVICDGWSLTAALADLARFYSAAGEGTQPILAPAVPFSQYASEQFEQLKSREHARIEDYWLRQFSTLPPPLELPSDHPRADLDIYEAHQVSRPMASGLYRALKQLSAEQSCSLFTTLLAGFELLLHRLTDQDELVVGVPLAAQTLLHGQIVVGHCVNLLPIQSRVPAQQTFAEFLAATKRRLLDAYAHQPYTLGMLMEKVKLSRNPGRVPLVSATFNLDRAASGLDFQNLEAQVEPNSRSRTVFDLVLNARETGDGLILDCVAKTALFEPETIQRWLSHLETLFQAIAGRPDSPVAALPWLNGEQQQQLLAGWNGSPAELPNDQCIHHLFEAQASRTPNAMAVVLGRQQLSYAELDRRADALARQSEALGVGPEVLVGLYIDRSVEMVVALLGILKAGGAYLALDPDYPKERLAYMLADSKAQVLVSRRSLAQSLPLQSLPVLWVEQLDGPNDPAPAPELEERARPEPHPDNLAYVLYTSGSTGKPKGVAIPHRAAVGLAYWAKDVFSPEDLSGVLASTSIGFDLSVFELLVPLSWGGTVILVQDAVQMPGLTQTPAVTLINTVPSVAAELSRLEAFPSSVRTINLAGEPLSGQLVDQLYQRTHIRRVLDLYGPTEDTVYSTFALRQPAGPATIGRPLPNKQVYILDRNGHLLPVGVAGELCLGGIGLARGYLNQADLTAKKFIPNPFSPQPGGRLYRTGDRARYLPDGNLEFLGRMDDQVKIRGYRIELGEIETVLSQHPTVRECVVDVREGSDRDKRLVAYVVRNSSDEASDQAHSVDEWITRQCHRFDALYSSAVSDVAGQESDMDSPISAILKWSSLPQIPDQIREYYDMNLGRILSLRPQRVFEIGCGTGQLLHRLAPHCSEYWASDFSEAAIQYVQDHLTQQGRSLPLVKLMVRPAHDFEDIPCKAFDTAIVYSVVQHFPNSDYFMRILEGALEVTASGGRVYLGNVQSSSLLETFYTALHLARAPANLTLSELKQRVQRDLNRPEELTIDPEFFLVLKRHYPRITHVEMHLRRGRILNETTQFHYDVILHLDTPAPLPLTIDWLHWQQDGLSLSKVRDLLQSKQPEILGLTAIPNARLAKALKAVELLQSDCGLATVEELRAFLREDPSAIDPEDLWILSETFPYLVHITWSRGGGRGNYDAVFIRSDKWAALQGAYALSEPNDLQPISCYVSCPLKPTQTNELRSVLQHYLANRLPNYMVPSAFMLLDALPRTLSGKIDRRSLPAQDQAAAGPGTERIAPQTPTEKALAAIWREVLELKEIGLHDNFFELGGHSLLITRLISRIRNVFHLDLPMRVFFEAPTVAALAAVIERLIPEEPSKSAELSTPSGARDR